MFAHCGLSEVRVLRIHKYFEQLQNCGALKYWAQIKCIGCNTVRPSSVVFLKMDTVEDAARFKAQHPTAFINPEDGMSVYLGSCYEHADTLCILSGDLELDDKFYG